MTSCLKYNFTPARVGKISFQSGEGDTRYENAQDAKGPTVSSAEVSSGSGGSGGLIVGADDGQITRVDNITLRFRMD